MNLRKIRSVKDLRKLSIPELSRLSSEVRELIIDVIAKNGGHLASSLGVVELTIALHYVFNTPKDILIWDVGHQSYAHKILTGRKDTFATIRKFGGLSGFPKVIESDFDSFNVGHSSTSLSLAIGCAVARDLNKENHKVIAVIGDGSMTGGIAFEALNNIGHLDNDVIIVLNDNEHSISKNVGALSKYLTRIITDPFYNRFRKKSMEFVKRIPKVGLIIYRTLYRFFEGFKGMLIPGRLFDDMGIRYFGPVDGHNIPLLINILNKVKQINSGPKIIHVITKKGMGYPPAEKDPALFHGIGPFDRKTGVPLNKSSRMSFSDVAGKTLASCAAKDKKIVAITAAMKLGTGLSEFEKRWPKRFFDVGIAEQYAITFAAALAARGMKPFVSIYSTFLQRAADQLIHDVAIMNLPVRILIDRAGIVGDDGETHHGLFDIAIIRSIPNFLFLAPSDGRELRDMIHFAVRYNNGPIAIRYPRGSISETALDTGVFHTIAPEQIQRITVGNDVCLLALGDMVGRAMELHTILKGRNISSTVVNLRSIKPLDLPSIESVVDECKSFITLENGVVQGGVGESIVCAIEKSLREKLLFLGGFPNEFVTHGSNNELFSLFGLDPEALSRRIAKEIKERRLK